MKNIDRLDKTPKQLDPACKKEWTTYNCNTYAYKTYKNTLLSENSQTQYISYDFFYMKF